MNIKIKHQTSSLNLPPGASTQEGLRSCRSALSHRRRLRDRIRSMTLALSTLAALVIGQHEGQAFSLIDSGSQGAVFCSTAGQAANIIANPNDHWWWGMPPNPPGPVVIRYRFTTAFDTAFANTAAHPNLNSAIKQQIDLAFDTWSKAGITPHTGASNFRRNGVQPFGDIRSICLHEIGHLMGLHHPDFGAGSMHNFCPSGGTFTSCPATGNATHVQF